MPGPALTRPIRKGRLSKLKAHLVSAARLHEVAQELGLGEYLFLGRGEEMSGGREKKALLSDAVEALIAALYLDAGLEAARQFIEARVVGVFQAHENGAEAPSPTTRARFRKWRRP